MLIKFLTIQKVKHGEREFEKEVEKERLKLKANEFLNLDAILESVMMSLVVRPLREHVYRLFVEHYAVNGSIQTLADSIQLAQPKHIQDLGVRVSVYYQILIFLRIMKILKKNSLAISRQFDHVYTHRYTYRSIKRTQNDKRAQRVALRQ